MEIASLADVPRYTEDPKVVDSQADLGKDAFLQLLTTQLKNQDPSNPVDNEAFVAQLAQFSSLEQLIGLQETMDNVYLGIAAMNNSSMSSLLGRDVVAVGNSFQLGPDGATLHFETNAPYEGGTISVIDDGGNVVFTGDLEAGPSGENSFFWKGQDFDGQPLDEGTYTFKVNMANEEVAVQELIVGTVDEMDYSSGVPLPSVNGITVSLDQVLRLFTGE